MNKGMENIDVRAAVLESGLKYKAIAYEMGISPEWLSKLMKKPLSADNKNRILYAINALKNKRDSMQISLREPHERMVIMMPISMMGYLQYVSEKENQSIGEYIRNLVCEDMYERSRYGGAQ